MKFSNLVCFFFSLLRIEWETIKCRYFHWWTCDFNRYFSHKEPKHHFYSLWNIISLSDINLYTCFCYRSMLFQSQFQEIKTSDLVLFIQFCMMLKKSREQKGHHHIVIFFIYYVIISNILFILPTTWFYVQFYGFHVNLNKMK